MLMENIILELQLELFVDILILYLIYFFSVSTDEQLEMMQNSNVKNPNNQEQ